MKKCVYCGGELEISDTSEWVENQGYICGFIEYECKNCNAIMTDDYSDEMD